MASTATVTIGVPTYNRCVTLQRTVESVLAQRDVDLELLVFDNSSTDDTPRHCAQFAARDQRVRYVRQAANVGATRNFCSALDAATSPFFMWLADDDWLEETSYVASCLRHLESHPECVLVGGAARYFDGDSFVLDGVAAHLTDSDPQARVLQYFHEVIDNAIFYGVGRRDHFSRMPLKGVLGGDWFWVASLAFLGHVETLQHIHLNRSTGGVSRDLSELAHAHQLNAFWVANPRLRIALNAFADIAFSPAYPNLSRGERLRFAYRAYSVICAKSGASFAKAIRGQLQIRTRLRGLLNPRRRRLE